MSKKQNKADIKTLRRIINEKAYGRLHGGNAEINERVTVHNKAVLSKMTKEQLRKFVEASVIEGAGCQRDVSSSLGFTDFYSERQIILDKNKAVFDDLSKKLDSIEVMQALGDDPSEELKAIAEAISKL